MKESPLAIALLFIDRTAVILSFVATNNQDTRLTNTMRPLRQSLLLRLTLWTLIMQHHQVKSFSVAFSSLQVPRTYSYLARTVDAAASISSDKSRTTTSTGSKDTIITATTLRAHPTTNKDNTTINRLTALNNIVSIPIFWSLANQIAQAKISIKPDDAFQSLLAARQELSTASKQYLSTRDYDGMKDYLSNPSLNINNYEENANALLASKQLDAESKRAIGTIRRYGVGADVIIMYGGLKAELEEEEANYGTLSKSLQRAVDSLDEVIAICKSNGF